MSAIRSRALHPDRLPQLLPFVFAALLFAGVALQSKLLPVKPMRLEIPSQVESGAAPEESVPPPSVTLNLTAPTAVLPRESVPDETASTIASPSVATVEPSVESPVFGAAGGIAMSRAIGLSGAGNLNYRVNRTRPVSVLLADLIQTIEHLKAKARSASQPVRRSAALKPVSRPAKAASSITGATAAAITTAKTSPSVTGIGGAAPPFGQLGGPASLTERFAATINGATIKRKF